MRGKPDSRSLTTTTPLVEKCQHGPWRNNLAKRWAQTSPGHSRPSESCCLARLCMPPVVAQREMMKCWPPYTVASIHRDVNIH